MYIFVCVNLFRPICNDYDQITQNNRRPTIGEMKWENWATIHWF